MNFPKFFPRFQKFLTENPCYTAEKKRSEQNFHVELKLNNNTNDDKACVLICILAQIDSTF